MVHPLLMIPLLAVGCSVLHGASAPWAAYMAREDGWFSSADGREITENILSWQSNHGSWPKNRNTAAQRSDQSPEKISGTFDNGATTGEMRFLAKAYRVTKNARCEEAFLKGLNGILKAQYPSGGWPQFYPPGTEYHRHITFNDGTMSRLMVLLREIATLDDYGFVAADRRRSAQAAFDRGIECILKCQIRVNEKLTVWCAQHDEADHSPRPGRTYELVSLSGSESAGILALLMSIEHPTPEIIRAVEAGVAWFDSARIMGIRVDRVNGERVVIEDSTAGPVWARFYEIPSNRPIFSGRDGVKKFAMAEIERERRNGYAWYGNWGTGVLEEYKRWVKRVAN